ncbi:MAG: SIR2 family protein [Pseudolysinimonas sp.]
MLVVTGAGASANLGVDNTALPMMKGWAADLVPRLGAAGGQLGLGSDTDGPAFEAIIGRFLKFANSLDAVTQLGFLGDTHNLSSVNGPMTPSGGNFSNWLSAAQGNVFGINRGIWESLWENFGRNRIDTQKADRAYGALHSLIRESREGDMPCYIAHATTNFDTAIEVAIEESDYPNTELLNGFANTSGYGRQRWSPNLLTTARTDSDGRIPVVHLHGAVGWYYDPANKNLIQRRPTDDGYDDRMTPALLLPDDTKRPDAFPGPLFEVWEQFIILLQQATHVFMIGHSLHDAHLVKAISEAGKPTAVMSLGKATIVTPNDAPSPLPLGHPSRLPRPMQWELLDPKESDRIERLIPGASVIPGQFGEGALASDFDAETFTKFLDRN